MRELIDYITKALVDHPDSVDVKEIEGEKTVVYELRVGAGDLGKVIGRQEGQSDPHNYHCCLYEEGKKGSSRDP